MLEFEFRFALLIGLPEQGKISLEKQGIGALEHRDVKVPASLLRRSLLRRL